MTRHSRVIRKITLGHNPLNDGLALVLYQSAGPRHFGYKITAIRENDQNHIEYGITRYTVYIQKGDLKAGKWVGEGEEVVWKEFERVPVSIEYKLPGDGPDEVIVG